MERIASFSVDHTKLKKGMYQSRIDGADIITYDLRMKVPNGGDYFSTGGAHTFEHLFATFARNSAFADSVVYVGPMGCRTGFYLIVKGLTANAAITLAQKSMAFIAGFKGDIPGMSEEECGNYTDQNLQEAVRVAADMVTVLRGWTPQQLLYTHRL